MEIKKIEINQLEKIKDLFKSVFMNEPWNDDWSDDEQLTNYILDLIGNKNSLAIGLFEDEELIGAALGSIMHWCAGTEYYIHEFFISCQNQHKGYGTFFIKQIEEYVKSLNVNHIFLQTDRNLPAYNFYKKSGFNELEKHASLVKMI